MKKKVLKIMFTLILIFCILTPYVHAGILGDASSWISDGSSSKTFSTAQGKMNKGVTELSGLLFVIGVFVAIVATIVLGIQFMTASSSENKAEIKKKATVVAVGVLVLFASAAIWKFVIEALSSGT